jgi:hypothetical protein
MLTKIHGSGQCLAFVHQILYPGDADAWLNEKYRKFIFDRDIA